MRGIGCDIAGSGISLIHQSETVFELELGGFGRYGTVGRGEGVGVVNFGNERHHLLAHSAGIRVVEVENGGFVGRGKRRGGERAAPIKALRVGNVPLVGGGRGEFAVDVGQGAVGIFDVPTYVERLP